MNTLRKLRSALYAALMLFGAFAFTSCDDDNITAMKLEGEWKGDFGMYFDNGYYRWECYNTYMRFENAFIAAASGYCKQVDYYNDPRCPYAYIYHYVDWKVRDGRITFKYRGEREWNTVISDYSLSSVRFYGHFADTGAPFDLRDVSMGDTWWSGYTGNYHYYDYGYDPYHPYYAKKKGNGEQTEIADAKENKTTKRADGFTLVKSKDDKAMLVDDTNNPGTVVVLREGVDPASIDLSNIHFGNRYCERLTEE